jgi:hypothetical protein
MRPRTVLLLTLLTAAAAAPVLAGFAGTDLFIPMAGRGVGAYPSNWFTTVYVYNPNLTAVSVDLTFLERNKDNVATAPPKVTESLAPGETKVYENIVEATFGKTGTVYGAVRIQCTEKVVASARVFSKESADAPLTQSFGQDFAATPASFAIGSGESTDILGGYTTQPHQDSEARYNIGCVETTGLGSAMVHWVARDADGVERGHYDRSVPRLSQTQGFFHDYFTEVALTSARITASVTGGSGKVICYGSLVTNDKTFPKPVQDPTTFEMVYPEKLLGIATVQHDATLTGDGTAGSPLGIADLAVSTAKLADGAVTPAKIDTTGAVGGQVLKVGSPAHWADDGLTLPYVGAAGSPGAPFQVKNTDTTTNSSGILGDGQYGVTGIGNAGFAGVSGWVRGETTYSTVTPAGVAGSTGGGIGVSGGALTGTGVFGSSATGYGVHGTSTGGDGVFGESAGTNKSGVFAVNDNAAGWAGFFRGRVGITSTLECTGCISKGDLSAAGGGGGKVLGTTGSALQWQDDGLALPFSGSAPTGGFVFVVTNSGSGSGISATSQYDALSGVSSAGSGVYGGSGSHTSSFAGVPSSGVIGDSSSGVGVRGLSDTNAGVDGASNSGDGVRGHTATGDHAVFGASTFKNTTGYLAGEYGASGIRGNNTGYLGYASAGVYGESTTSGGNGVIGVANTGSNAYGVWGQSSSGYAGYFSGNVQVSGNLSATGTKPFVIDHPLDPANRELWHAAIESNEVLDVYSGNVTTDADGLAVVRLPDWFEALNTDFRYQLTCVGRFAQAIVESEIAANRFTIRTNLAQVKVSWQVTARRNDAWMRAHPFAAERDKPAAERGTYLTPLEHGQPEEKGVEWVRQPEVMRQMAQARIEALERRLGQAAAR